MNSFTKTLFLLVTVFLLHACGGGGGGNGNNNSPFTGSAAGSCYQTSSGYCTYFTGSTYTATTVSNLCAPSGQVLPGDCPTANRVATCFIQAGKSNERTTTYFSSSYSIASAQSACNVIAASGQTTVFTSY